jgi:hypothetical protein
MDMLMDLNIAVHQPLDIGYIGTYSMFPMTETTTSENRNDKHLYMNLSLPFNVICIGGQGSGKSHTLLSVMENCMIDCPLPHINPKSRVNHGMCGLALHYSQNNRNCCRATDLVNVDSNVYGSVKGVNKVIMFVSPFYFHQRRKQCDINVEICPLMFAWKQLEAHHIRNLLGLDNNTSDRTVNFLVSLLRRHQMSGWNVSYEDFTKEAMRIITDNDSSGYWLGRLEFMQGFIRESNCNQQLNQSYYDLNTLMKSDTLIVCDMTDPLLSPTDACHVFTVILDLFRNAKIDGNCGKVIMMDDINNYLSCDHQEFTSSLIDTLRSVTQENNRVLISTSNPEILSAEIMSLATISVIHKSQSNQTNSSINSLITLPKCGLEIIRRLRTGEALISTSTIQKDLLKMNGVNEDNISRNWKSSDYEMLIVANIRHRISKSTL